MGCYVGVSSIFVCVFLCSRVASADDISSIPGVCIQDDFATSMAAGAARPNSISSRGLGRPILNLLVFKVGDPGLTMVPQSLVSQRSNADVDHSIFPRGLSEKKPVWSRDPFESLLCLNQVLVLSCQHASMPATGAWL